MSHSRRRALLRVLLFAGFVVGLFVLGQSVDIEEHVGQLRRWLLGFGVWAPAVFIAFYVLGTSAGLPGTPLTVLAAIAFGPWIGLLAMIVATSLAATVGFSLSRWVIRAQVEALLAARRPYTKLKELVEESPWTAIPFARLNPAFPFAFVNYALGLSRVSFGRYLLASELAMIPMNVVWVWSAGSAYSLVIRGEIPWVILIGSVLGAATMFALTVAVRRRQTGAGGASVSEAAT